MLENISTKTKFIFLGILALILVIVIFLSLDTTDKSNQAPASTQFASDAPCYIVGGEKLFERMDAQQFLSLRKNLTQYAREYIKSTDPKIDYELVGDISGDDSEVEFGLKSLNTPKHEIVLSLKTLPNSRLSIIIKDKKTGSSDYSESLEANSTRNVFISTLPINSSGYIIDYDVSVDKFRIILNTKSEVNRTDALAFVSSKIGVDRLEDKDYNLVAPGYLDDFGGIVEDEAPEGD
jgi:hypothetical protein